MGEDVHFALERTGSYPGVTMLHTLKEVLTASDGDKLPRYLPSCSGLHCGGGCLPVKYCNPGSRRRTLPCNNDPYDHEDYIDNDHGHGSGGGGKKKDDSASFRASSTGFIGIL